MKTSAKGLSSVTEVRIEKGRVELPSGEWGVVPEQNRRERGHTFYPPFEDLAKIPALYATDGQAVEEKTIYLHYFTGGSGWYIAELDPTTGLAFGWARVNYPSGEWGYVNLIELEELCIAPRVVAQGEGRSASTRRSSWSAISTSLRRSRGTASLMTADPRTSLVSPSSRSENPLQSILITPNAECAELVRPSLEDYARRTDSTSSQMLDDVDELASAMKSMITDLCHLADAAGIPGDREELVMRAYWHYRTERAYEALDADE